MRSSQLHYALLRTLFAPGEVTHYRYLKRHFGEITVNNKPKIVWIDSNHSTFNNVLLNQMNYRGEKGFEVSDYLIYTMDSTSKMYIVKTQDFKQVLIDLYPEGNTRLYGNTGKPIYKFLDFDTFLIKHKIPHAVFQIDKGAGTLLKTYPALNKDEYLFSKRNPYLFEYDLPDNLKNIGISDSTDDKIAFKENINAGKIGELIAKKYLSLYKDYIVNDVTQNKLFQIIDVDFLIYSMKTGLRNLLEVKTSFNTNNKTIFFQTINRGKPGYMDVTKCDTLFYVVRNTGKVFIFDFHKLKNYIYTHKDEFRWITPKHVGQQNNRGVLVTFDQLKNHAEELGVFKTFKVKIK